MSEIPVDYQAEKNLITSVASIPEWYQEISHLSLEHFFDLTAKNAYSEMSQRSREGRGWMQVDEIANSEWILMGQIGLTKFQFDEAIRRVEDAYVRRKAYMQALEIVKASLSGDTRAVEVLSSDFELPARNLLGKTVDLIVADLYDRIGQYDAEIVPTGFPQLDRMGILRRRESMGLAGRPAMGKSQLAFQWAGDLTMTGGVAVVASLEMAEQEMVARIVGSMSGTSLRDAKSEREIALVSSAMEKLIQNKRLIVIDQDITTEDLWGICYRVKADLGRLDLVVADHIRLFSDKNDQERHRLGRIVHNLRRLAKDLDCAVVPLIQLSRGPEGRKDKRPGLGDLRDSGEIEENLDVASFIYRGQYYSKDKAQSQSGEADLYAKKNRNGKLWFSKLWFDADSGPRFAPLARDDGTD